MSEWQQSLSSSSREVARATCQTGNGGLIPGAVSDSALGGNKTNPEFGRDDFYLATPRSFQAVAAPRRTVPRSAADPVTVSWPSPAGGWELEAANALPTVSAPWPQIPPPYQTNAGVISVTVTNTPAVGNQFFRLHKQ